MNTQARYLLIAAIVSILSISILPNSSARRSGNKPVTAIVSSPTGGPGTESKTSNTLITVAVCTANGVVTTNADSGAGSLRQAILDACAGGTITFDMNQVTSPVTLASAELLIDRDLTIQGPGANQLTVARSAAGGTPNFRLFEIASGAITVNISGLTISNGRSADGLPTGNGADGGGILNNPGATLNLTNVAISGNQTGVGSGGLGGGSGGNGGGIANNGGTLNLVNSTLRGNQAGAGGSLGFGGGRGGDGGGIFNDGGMVNVINSTLSGNQAGAGGTSFDNTVASDGSGGNGGGIASNSGTLNIIQSTLSGNQTGAGSGSGGRGSGGGVLNGGTTNVKNTIIAGNTFGTNGSCPDFSGTLNSQGHNLVGNGDGSSGSTNGGNGDQVGTTAAPANPLLAPLGNYGGPTQTHALLPGSPAIDAGDDCVLTNSCPAALASVITTDQRGAGFDRSADGNGDGTARVDIGAYEVQAILVTNTNDSGLGSLRQAINDADADAATKAINFQMGLTGTITLLNQLPPLSSPVSINGPGANQLTVQRATAGGTPTFSVFVINAGNNVTISGLTVSHGSLGGIFNDRGTVITSNCVISGNDFAGINNGSNQSGTFTVNDSMVSNNTGSGIYNRAGLGSATTLTINNSTIAGNANSGVFNSGDFGGTATLKINNTTVSGNNTGGASPGGGIDNSAAAGGAVVATVNNSTISGNNAAPGTGHAGGISVSTVNSGSTSSVTINSSTISGNTAPGSDSGSAGGLVIISLLNGTSTLKLTNTIVADNLGNSGASASDISGTVDPASSFNLIGTGGSGGLSNGVNNNQVGVANSLLGPLANNGGPMQTHAVLPGSPAINAGSNANLASDTLDRDGDGNTAEPIPFDQRGFPRITSTTVDIGAFESRGFTISATSGTPQKALAGTAFSSPLVATVSSAFSEPVAGGQVRFTAPASGASGTFAGSGTNTATVTLNGSGIATSPTFTANSFGGTYLVTASTSITSATSFNLSNVPALSINDVSTTEGDSGTRTLNFTVTLSAASNLTVTVNYATANITATAPSDYTAIGSTLLTFNPGEMTKTISVTISGDQTFEPDETFVVNLSGAGNATLADNQGQGTILNDDAQGGIISFSSGTYTVAEDGRAVAITVNRTGDTSAAATVDYATSDDSGASISCAAVNNHIASSRCDFTTAAGTLKFAAGETSKTFKVTTSQDSYVENSETFPITLSNLTGGAVFGVPATVTVTITDDVPEPATNPIDDADNFVRQQYHDFLNREGDPGGQAFWTTRITDCGSDAACINRQRIGVSAQFFIEQEFQQTGFYVYRAYKAALGRRPTYLEFMTDRSQLQANPNLDAEKVAYTLEFVQRGEFTIRYAAAVTADAFVDALIQNVQTNSGVDLTPRRSELLAAYNAGSDQIDSRARTLRTLVDHADFQAAEFNRGFVLAQYFSYLRRNPDTAGYNFWVNVLNNNPNDFRAMVCNFITSFEYQDRFGALRTHSNSECSGSPIAEPEVP